MNREQEFKDKIKGLLERENLSAQLIEKGLADLDFLLIGMTIKGEVFITSGLHSFVANGYEPAGCRLSDRNSPKNIKFILTETYAVERKDNTVKLRYLFNDRNCLNPQKILPILKQIAGEHSWLPWQNELTTMRLYEDSNTELMLVLYTYQGKCVTCSLDNGRITIIKDKSWFAKGEHLYNVAGKTCQSGFSVYCFNDKQGLDRIEWERTGGIDCFIS